MIKKGHAYLPEESRPHISFKDFCEKKGYETLIRPS
jgi:hypothetical protein